MRWRYIISTGNEVAFPYRSPELGAPDHFHMSPARLAFAKWRAYQVRKSPTPVELISLRGTYRPLMKDDLPLIFLTRNSLRFVASFTEHYRKMGVTRFLCVDDRSTDGTRERLLSEEDVEVFSSNKRYREANGGIQWRESLLNMFGTGRWYLNVDCDEYFIYENMINMKLQEYTSTLKSLGVRHVPAPMIDLYPSYPLSSAVFTGDEGKMPWHVADCFDRTGYRLFRSGSSMLMSGGPRHRLIGNLSEHDELMKYPLLYVEYPTTLSISVHKPWPFEWNFSPVLGALLHFKFFNETEEFARAAIADNQYYKGGRAYKNMLNAIEAGALNKLHDQKYATKYESPDQLLRLGFFKKLP